MRKSLIERERDKGEGGGARASIHDADKKNVTVFMNAMFVLSFSD